MIEFSYLEGEVLEIRVINEVFKYIGCRMDYESLGMGLSEEKENSNALWQRLVFAKKVYNHAIGVWKI